MWWSLEVYCLSPLWIILASVRSSSRVSVYPSPQFPMAFFSSTSSLLFSKTSSPQEAEESSETGSWQRGRILKDLHRLRRRGFDLIGDLKSSWRKFALELALHPILRAAHSLCSPLLWHYLFHVAFVKRITLWKSNSDFSHLMTMHFPEWHLCKAPRAAQPQSCCNCPILPYFLKYFL